MNSSQTPNSTRPPFLKALCILSWINAGITIISSSLYKLVSGKLSQTLDYITDESAREDLLLQMEFLDKNSLWIVVLYLGSILGVYMMWSRNRNGFYIYVGVQVLLVLLPFTFFPFNVVDLISSSFISIIFVFMYYRNLYFMNS
ncbi:MAG: hypothetical protein CL853_00840 [Crocinitomicaceae bacterium]|nr:hypothetical protein [Crocinitomicaceae bacterium]|tara:strand:- start:273 stop:704 length:432 start_codon:yes stop_codon:yes gene_type:complete